MISNFIKEVAKVIILSLLALNKESNILGTFEKHFISLMLYVL